MRCCEAENSENNYICVGLIGLLLMFLVLGIVMTVNPNISIGWIVGIGMGLYIPWMVYRDLKFGLVN